ncbi:aminotransferase class III-fold pyridoxal phosphate-dependent enzyme [Streptomyces sp. NEAU-Y11]|uniref:aminotransferase class III-fold pyridoxal phosphate-dependent enzyme n=1 Tax=Streptomyces cucumeris TaxID=2962890 RepID=UPI0020C8F5E4|nr:aminotransferase class III-fold pyridoxal phosphate-dependent enzyme [Streptomyces sp. NEAU-Y11]MCP9206550.1 aminotransferase class III-fold pyridoxal phosphate-dependent enzyme [Streptomyces sp. NEAU-Y11]
MTTPDMPVRNVATSGQATGTDGPDLLRRAHRVIPGGVWGHNRYPAAYDPDAYPAFAERGEGARLLGTDGRWYNDFLCGYGAMINGYGRQEIDGPAARRAAGGPTLTTATPASVELAELLVDLVDGADWATWGTSGSDATWTALLLARAHTGRRTVAVVDGAYHGSHGWCGWCNAPHGRHTDDRAAVLTLPWNDIGALDALFAAEGHQLAAVMITPFHHPIPGASELPDPAWLSALRAHCDHWGTLLISDDVRAGFRLDLRGSHTALGFSPDLVCFSKALGNGWPIAAVVGHARLRAAADEMFLAGTFWNSSPAMAAAAANLELLRKEDGVARMREAGEAFGSGLVRLAERHGVPLRISGPAAIPTATVDGDEDHAWMRRFAVHMAAQGTLIHPMHNWFVSTAHDSAVVEETLAHADTAMARTQEEGPAA